MSPAFYVGGSFGAALGGLAWTLGGWPACVALVVAMLVIMAAIVYFRLGAPRAGRAGNAADRAALSLRWRARAARSRA